MQAALVLVITVIGLAGCRANRHDASGSAGSAAIDPWAATPAARARDYAEARRTFHTQLVRQEPSPQPYEPVKLAADASELAFTSGKLALTAWVSKPIGSARGPAVLFLHGGFAFSAEDWEMAKPFRDAGFVTMMPLLRGENGKPGAFTLYYDEVDDVLAAADALAKRPDVDPDRIFVAGHSAGGALAMLAAMTSKRFRAVASLSGSPDQTIHKDQSELVPFDPSNADEFRMRSPLEFASSFKCPARLYYGDQETWLRPLARDTAQRAHAAGLDVEGVSVRGDHFSMITSAIPLAIAFFEQQR